MSDTSSLFLYVQEDKICVTCIHSGLKARPLMPLMSDSLEAVTEYFPQNQYLGDSIILLAVFLMQV